MSRVTVCIFHAEPGPEAGPLTRLLADARRRLAERRRSAFVSLADSRMELDVRLVAETPGETPFGHRLAGLVRDERIERLVVLGSGAVPLARPADLRPFLDAAAGAPGRALTNNRFSSDILAVSRAADLAVVPDLTGDNALPRWLAEHAGVEVADLRSRAILQVDLDTPADLALLATLGRLPRDLAAIGHSLVGRHPAFAAALAGIRSVLADPRAELVVAGRLSARVLARLERETACRVRALVEERGLRASSQLAIRGTSPARPPRSVLGLLLDRDGPATLSRIVGELGDAAVVDTRVLLAHRLGADEGAWPPAEERFASDLLDARSIGDQWLRELTAGAARAPLPILLGGHSLVGPGLELLARSGGA